MSRVLLVWVLFIPLAILNGAVRESLLIPLLGKTALPLSGVLLSCLFFATTYMAFPFLKISSGQQCWQVGLTWLILTVVFEFLFGHFAMGKAWQELLRAYDVQGGNLWVVVLLVVFVSPYLSGKLRGLD